MDKKIKIIITTLVLVFLTIIGILTSLLLTKPKNTTELQTNNLKIDTSAKNIEKSINELTDVTNKRVFFAGIGDGAVHKDGEIFLKNPKSNEDIYMKYTIINEATGEEVFTTDLIEPSEEVAWIPGETLPLGQYNFKFIEEPFYQAENSDEWIPLTTGNNHVIITIVE